MKKGILLGIAGLFILTGCGNKVVCTGKIDESGTKAEAKITATIKSDKVSKVSAKMTFADEKTAKTVCTYADLANTLAEKKKIRLRLLAKEKLLLLMITLNLLMVKKKSLECLKLTSSKQWNHNLALNVNNKKIATKVAFFYC